MTQPCDGTTRRQDYSSAYDNDTKPGACVDEQAAARLADDERAAADRRDSWITGSGGISTMQGTERLGRTDHASVWGPNDQAKAELAKKHAADAKRTAQVDPHLQDDKVGNLLPGLVVGVVGGLARGLGQVAFEGAAGITKEVAKHVGKEVVEDAVKDVTVHVVVDGAEETLHEAAHGSGHGVHVAPVHDAPVQDKETHEAPAREGRSEQGGTSRPIGPPAPQQTTCEPPVPYIRVQG